MCYKDAEHFVSCRSEAGSQQVDFRFQLGFAEYITSCDHIISVFVDGRGSGYRGNKLLQSVAGRPGELEIEDITAVLRWT